MQTVLVAGGAGFIGSHLCKSLLDKNFKVLCIDNEITGSQNNVKALEENPNFQFIKHDVVLPFPQEIISQDISYIFHLASPASPNAKSPNSYINHPIETLLVNGYGSYQLLELAKNKNAKLLYASSSEVYGDPHVSPQPETYFGNVNPNGIRSVYDEGKRYGEAITMAYHRKFNLQIVIVRIFNTYGENMDKNDGRVVSNFIMQSLQNQPITIYGDGSQTRSFCYVSDMVEGLQKAMFSKNSGGGVFNLGNPDERKILELATMVKEMTGSQSEIVYEDLPQDDPKLRKPNVEKAKQTLQWSPKVSLEEGLKKTIAYFKTVA